VIVRLGRGLGKNSRGKRKGKELGEKPRKSNIDGKNNHSKGEQRAESKVT
jgi:hypothetical protein